jgi:hypothetical protein
MARPPRRPSETDFAKATPPVAIPDPAPAASAPMLAPPVVSPAPPPVADPEPDIDLELSGVGQEEPDPDAMPTRRRRKPGKHTLYADAQLIFKLQDLTMRWQRKYLRRHGKIPAGVIEDAVLATALNHLPEVEEHLRRSLQ